MPRHRKESELDALNTQYEALGKRIKEVEARDRALRAAENHRRCVLAGTVALEKMQADPGSEFAKTLLGLINAGAKSGSDRALFNLSPLTNGSKKSERHSDGSPVLPGNMEQAS